MNRFEKIEIKKIRHEIASVYKSITLELFMGKCKN